MTNRLNVVSVVSGLLIPFFSMIPTQTNQISSNLSEHSLSVVDPCLGSNTVFQDGEQITYKLYYNWNFVWLPAGEVVFKVKERENEYHISAVGKTYSSYEWFFKVDDYYETVLDKKTLRPKSFVRDIKEGKFYLYNRINFDQKNGKAVSYQGPDKNSTKREEFSFSNCMHDMLSIVYYLRNVDYSYLKAKQEFPVEVFLDGKGWPVNVTYNGKHKNIKIKGGDKYNTLMFTPEMIAGTQFKEGTKMNVWVSDDNNKVPVMLESPVSVGSIRAVLIDYKGLKHPLSAKLN